MGTMQNETLEEKGAEPIPGALTRARRARLLNNAATSNGMRGIAKSTGNTGEFCAAIWKLTQEPDCFPHTCSSTDMHI